MQYHLQSGREKRRSLVYNRGKDDAVDTQLLALQFEWCKQVCKAKEVRPRDVHEFNTLSSLQSIDQSPQDSSLCP